MLNLRRASAFLYRTVYQFLYDTLLKTVALKKVVAKFLVELVLDLSRLRIVDIAFIYGLYKTLFAVGMFLKSFRKGFIFFNTFLSRRQIVKS